MWCHLPEPVFGPLRQWVLIAPVSTSGIPRLVLAEVEGELTAHKLGYLPPRHGCPIGPMGPPFRWTLQMDWQPALRLPHHTDQCPVSKKNSFRFRSFVGSLDTGHHRVHFHSWCTTRVASGERRRG